MYENESSFPNLDEEEPCATTQLIVLGNINRGLAFATSIDVETIFRYPGNYGLYRRISGLRSEKASLNHGEEMPHKWACISGG